jgi:hypothetical protein
MLQLILRTGTFNAVSVAEHEFSREQNADWRG